MVTFKSIIIFGIIFLAGCTSINVENYQPKKISNIPDGAFWKGGLDGGNWFLVKRVNNHKNAVELSIFNDQDGTLIMTKSFMLICRQDFQTQIGDLSQQINSFDGEKIFFIKSDSVDCYLMQMK